MSFGAAPIYVVRRSATDARLLSCQRRVPPQTHVIGFPFRTHAEAVARHLCAEHAARLEYHDAAAAVGTSGDSGSLVAPMPRLTIPKSNPIMDGANDGGFVAEAWEYEAFLELSSAHGLALVIPYTLLEDTHARWVYGVYAHNPAAEESGAYRDTLESLFEKTSS
jgi:hypothetical protein